jgi:uncharacterized membrane protein
MKIKKRITIYVFLMAVLFLSSNAYPQLNYQYTDIGSLSPVGINNSNQIVGAYSGGGFLFENGKLTPINYPGSADSQVTDINNLGQMVGVYTDDPNDPRGAGKYSYFYSGGTYTSITFPGATRTWAYGINDLGQIVGTYEDGGQYGFLLENGVYTTLSHSGGTIRGAESINNDGQIVGMLSNSYAYLLDGSDLTSFRYPGSTWTNAEDINNNGDIVGVYTYSNECRNQHGQSTNCGYVLSNGQYTPINYPGVYYTNALGSNDNGTIVGVYSGTGGYRGFVATAVVPEPISSTLFIVGGATLGFRRFRRKFKK